MKTSWVQDMEKGLAQVFIARKNEDLNGPQGSKYAIGESKSGKVNEKGIYFEDPTG